MVNDGKGQLEEDKVRLRANARAKTAEGAGLIIMSASTSRGPSISEGLREAMFKLPLPF